METVSVRRATEIDLTAIQRVGLLTWPATYLPLAGADHVIDGLSSWWTTDAVLRSIRDDDTFVAEVDGQIVGTGTLGRHEGTPVIWKIYVLPGGQRQGVGSALMRQLLATALPSEDVLIEFVSNNAVSRTFYERFGFAPDHEDTKNEHITTTWYRRPAKSR